MDCPSCHLPLESQSLDGEILERCERCGGEYVARDALGRLLSRYAASPSSRETAYTRPSPFSDPVRYRKCPACGEMMLRKNFRESSGVIVDVCAAHGVWFDRGELATILAFASTGALAKAERDIADRAAAKKKLDGWGHELRAVGPRHYIGGACTAPRRGSPSTTLRTSQASSPASMRTTSDDIGGAEPVRLTQGCSRSFRENMLAEPARTTARWAAHEREPRFRHSPLRALGFCGVVCTVGGGCMRLRVTSLLGPLVALAACGASGGSSSATNDGSCAPACVQDSGLDGPAQSDASVPGDTSVPGDALAPDDGSGQSDAVTATDALAEAGDAGPLRPCVGDAGAAFSAWIQDAGIGHLCDSLLCNVEVSNTGTGPIGPITATIVHVPAVGASWSVSPGSTYPAIAPGKTAVITVGNPAPTACRALSCPGPVDIEIEISGPGIPPGSRACGLAPVSGC
jgi:Zn-finger nucleic acid-binding protein